MASTHKPGLDEQQKRLAEELLFSVKKAPSFAKKLYFGQLDTTHIFPYPHISPEEEVRSEAFLKKLNEFAQKEIDPRWIDQHSTIPDNVTQGLSKLGAMGMTIPKEYGGLGMSQYAYCKATELLAARCYSTALYVNVHQSIGIRAILLFGTKEQKERWLRPLALGEQLAAFSLTEANAGSDASGIETRAVFDPEKNVYRINGKKQWTTNGGIANVLTLMAKTEIDTPQGKQDKITAFLVTPEMPGFFVTDVALDKVGMRGTKTGNLAFRNMEVPAANVLGQPGAGLRICLTVLDYGRTTFGASCTGVAKSMLSQAVEHAKTRIQFKRPLASFGLVKQKISNMAALTYAMDATTYMTAGLIDSGVEDFMLEAAMLKVFASDALWSIIYDTMQIFGGRSFFTDAPFERAMRDARLNMIGEGSNEVMRAFIGAVGMRDVGMELKSFVDALQHPISKCDQIYHLSKKGFKRLLAPHMPIKSPLLRLEATALSNAIRRFGISVVRMLAHYREQVVEAQLDLDRIATSAMAIYTSTAVLSKLDADLERVKNNPAALGNDVAIAKFYCHQAMKSIDHSLNTLFDSADQTTLNLSDQIIGI